MAAQKNIFNTLFLLVAAFVCIILVVQASPVPEAEEVAAVDVSAEDTDAARDGRFYGLESAQATAVATATANSGSYGHHGYPYGHHGYHYGK